MEDFGAQNFSRWSSCCILACLNPNPRDLSPAGHVTHARIPRGVGSTETLTHETGGHWYSRPAAEQREKPHIYSVERLPYLPAERIIIV